MRSLLLLLMNLRVILLRLSGRDEDLEGIDARLEVCVFFREVLVALLEVRDVFCSFGEDGCLWMS